MAKPRKRQGDSSVSDPTAFARENGFDAPDRDRISTRAYELYLARGASDGQAWDDWLAAEREVTQSGSRHSHGDSDE